MARGRSAQTSSASSEASTTALLTGLVSEHQGVMLRIARQFHRRAVTAEDIVQEAFLVACANAQRLREVDSAGAWLAGVTRKLALQASRKRKRRDALLQLHWHRNPAAWDLESLERGWRVEEVLRAAEALPRGQRKTLHYMLVHGMTDKEIAAALGVAEATVRGYRFRAIRRLKQLLG